MKPKKGEKTSLSLDKQTLLWINQIKSFYGVNSTTDAVRIALKMHAERILGGWKVNPELPGTNRIGKGKKYSELTKLSRLAQQGDEKALNSIEEIVINRLNGKIIKRDGHKYAIFDVYYKNGVEIGVAHQDVQLEYINSNIQKYVGCTIDEVEEFFHKKTNPEPEKTQTQEHISEQTAHQSQKMSEQPQIL